MRMSSSDYHQLQELQGFLESRRKVMCEEGDLVAERTYTRWSYSLKNALVDLMDPFRGGVDLGHSERGSNQDRRTGTQGLAR